jgi:hypothetical protein
MRYDDPSTRRWDDSTAAGRDDDRQEQYLASLLEAMSHCSAPALGMPWLPSAWRAAVQRPVRP